jgi:tape measure domain-containing protein
MADTTLQVKIGLEDDLSSGLRKIEGNFGDFNRGIQTNIKNAIGTIARLGTVLGTAGSIAGGFAIKTASELQALATNFRVLTGSAEEGKKVFQDLKKLGAVTPFSTTDLAKATQTMLAFGIETKDVEKYLRMLGDVSLGNKDKLAGLTLAFSQMKAVGKLTGEDLNQMIERGFNPLTIMSEKSGKSVAQLRDEMSKGKITVEDVTKAFEIATSEGGQFYKGMEEGAKDLSGKFATLGDGISNMSSGILGLKDDGTILEGSLMSLVEKGVDYLNERLAAIDWVKVGDDINNNIKKAIEDTSTAIQNLINWYNQHKVAVDFAIATLGTFVTALTVARTAIWLYTTAMTVATAITGSFAGILAFITSPITITIAIISVLAGVIYTLWKNWGTLTAQGTFLGDKIQWVKDRFNQLKDSVFGLIGALGNIRMPQALTDIWDRMKSVGNIPGLGGLFGRKAIGGLVHSSGLYKMNETGQEAVFLPQGARVVRSSETRDMLQSTKQGVTQNNYITMNNSVDWEIGTSILARKLRLS